MPKGRKRPIVDVGLDKTGSVTQVATVTTEFLAPRAPSVGNFNYTSKRRIRSALVVTVPQPGGWRPPTAYRSAAARRVSLPFSFKQTRSTSTITRISGGSVPTSGSTYGYAPNDTLFFTNLGVPSVSVNTVHYAETEALNKLRDARIDLGASLAELGETVDYIADVAEVIAAIILAVKRGDWKHAARIIGHRGRHPKDVAESWLAFKFGLLPLMSDAFGAMEAFSKGILAKDTLIHVSRQVTVDVTPIWIPTGNWTGSSQSGKVEESCKVVIYAQIADATRQALSSWGLTNPFAAAWEGLGWSFLIDWVLPIGNFLKALDATVGLTFKGGTKTTRIYANLSYDVWPNVSGADLVGGPCRTKYKCLATERTVYNDWPTPWTYIKNPLSNSHTSIVAALILSIGSD
jgi:hypothetical protein